MKTLKVLFFLAATWVAGSVSAQPVPNASVYPTSIRLGQNISLVQDGSTPAGYAWSENIMWRPNSGAENLGNNYSGYTTVTYTPADGAGYYIWQYRLVDANYDYTDQFVGFWVGYIDITPSFTESDWTDGDGFHHHNLNVSIDDGGTVSRDLQFATAASQWTIWPSEDSGTVTSTAHMYFNSVGASPSCVSFWMRSGLQDTDNVPATGKPPAYRNSRDAVYAALYKQATGTWNLVKIGEYWGGGISTGSPYYYDITFTSRTTTQIVYEVVKRWSDDDSVLSDQTVTYNIPTQ